MSQFLLGDTFENMATLANASVDMVLCDLPYGTTQNKWDSVLPLDRLWEEYWRVCKPNAAIVLTAAQPFTTVLAASQLSRLKYDWVWEKPMAVGHLNAKKQPMRAHETVLLFYKNQPTYNPQKEPGEAYHQRGGSKNGGRNYGQYGDDREGSKDGSRYPRSVVKINGRVERGHPTQKPVALFEYLIRTYTNPGDVVLDNTAGSGTTAIAALNAGREYICIERDVDYWLAAIERVERHKLALRQGST